MKSVMFDNCGPGSISAPMYNKKLPVAVIGLVSLQSVLTVDFIIIIVMGYYMNMIMIDKIIKTLIIC